MTNIQLLKGKIKGKAMTQDGLADEVGIDRSTYYRKMQKDGLSFTVEEVGRIADILDLSDDEIIGIFFNRKLA